MPKVSTFAVALNSDPGWEFAQVKFLGYSASKAALNKLTLHLAAELKGSSIKVNAAHPGFTAIAVNDPRGYKAVEQGAIGAVWLVSAGG